MTNKEKKDWLSVQYPLTVISDRYDGTYSGASWLAFPLDYDMIPKGVDASDPECAQFWKNYKEPVGRGAYASDAVVDLIQQMRESEPEESEDERMTNALWNLLHLHYAQDDAITLVGIKAGVFRSWLKKQKEQKPSDLPAGFYYIDGKGNKYYSKEFRCSNELGGYVSLKVAEQKPVEGKEYTSPDCGTSACCDDERFEIIAQAKKDIIEKTNIAENELSMELPLLDGILMRVWQVGWLNKKPAEWSEEDEKMIQSLILGIDKYVFFAGIKSKKIITWLKSLRPKPHWKPSEEQIEALWETIDFAPETFKPKCTLESLYNDLKKLIKV